MLDLDCGLSEFFLKQQCYPASSCHQAGEQAAAAIFRSAHSIESVVAKLPWRTVLWEWAAWLVLTVGILRVQFLVSAHPGSWLSLFAAAL